MNTRRVIPVFMLALLAAALLKGSVPAEAADESEWLVVLNTRQGQLEPSGDEEGGYRLSLHGVSDHILAFSSLAQGSMNALDLQGFVEKWNRQKDRSPAPRAALDTLKDETDEVYALELGDVELDRENTLTFKVRPAQGEERLPGRLSHRQNSAGLPEEFGTAALFIDNADFLMEEHG